MARKCELADNKEHRVYIRISDENNWNTIVKISKSSEKYKSANAIVNAALYYGLPLLLKATTGEVSISDDIKDNMELIVNDGEVSDRMLNAQVVKLLREINLNTIINKLIVSQLMNAKILESTGNYKEKLNNGAYSDTPEFLEDYETSELKKLR